METAGEAGGAAVLVFPGRPKAILCDLVVQHRGSDNNRGGGGAWGGSLSTSQQRRGGVGTKTSSSTSSLKQC